MRRAVREMLIQKRGGKTLEFCRKAEQEGQGGSALRPGEKGWGMRARSREAASQTCRPGRTVSLGVQRA